MTYSFTTEPIDRAAGEGAINEAIEAVLHGKTKKDPIDDDDRIPVEAAKRAVHGLIGVLDPDVVSYTVSINGVRRSSRSKPSLSVTVQVVEYAKSDDDEE